MLNIIDLFNCKINMILNWNVSNLIHTLKSWLVYVHCNPPDKCTLSQ